MKKTLFALLALLPCMLSAQVAENEAALVYHLPKTVLALEIDYTKTIETPGRFCQYAERYLGTTDAITTPTEYYELTAIRITAKTEADATRSYTLPIAQKQMNGNRLFINEKGILESINTQPAACSKCHKDEVRQHHCATSPSVIPLLEEQMLANSAGKMAEGAARLIYRLRENRLNLLAGDVEHLPQDGESMKAVLREMQQRETQLTELFTGHRDTQTASCTILYVPTADATEEVVMRFSRYQGPVPADDLSGEPLLLTLTAHKKSYKPQEEKQQKPVDAYIYYNLPGSADVSISYDERTMASRWLPIAQFGIAMPLPAELFNGKQKTTVEFNTRTGAIKSIGQ